MMENINILLCYDSNYNIQGQVTIYSLLENTNNKINFHIDLVMKKTSLYVDKKLIINRGKLLI